MKKVSELVNYRNLYKDKNWQRVVKQFSSEIKDMSEFVEHVKENTDVDFSEIQNNLQKSKKILRNTVNDYQRCLEELTTLIKKSDRHLRDASEDLSKASLIDPPDHILNKVRDREKTHHEFTTELFNERCKSYSSWKYPGMHIRPGHTTWTKSIVDLDPLYLVDTHWDLLEPSKNKFNEHYKSRLRFSVISDIDNSIFENFPQNQFGLILATEFFNQKSLAILEKYCREIFELLRHGGVFIFTFNDCDFSESVKNAENMYDCYTPGNEVKSILEKTGFEIVEKINSNGTLNWLEAKRPGDLTSLRAGQTLAQIKTREND